MKKQIITTLAIILALPLVFAMYGGENKTIPFSFETDDCTIVPNVTEGINFTFNGNDVIVKTEINFIGEYNITCYDWLTKEEESYSSGSPAPNDWSAKCGYNKECLYGKDVSIDITNNTEINNTNQTIPDVQEPEQVKLNIFHRFWNWFKGLFK